jgi:hypothetical protein
MHDLFAVKDLPPPVPEDCAAREVRRLSAAREKKEKDATKTRRDRKVHEREALLRRHRHQWLEGLPKEESPSESVSEEESEDSDDDDAGSRYDTMTFLSHLLDVRSLQGPVGRGSTSRASRAASAPVEGKEERPEGRAYEGPSERRSVEPDVLPATSAAPRTHARSLRTSLVGGTVAQAQEVAAKAREDATRAQEEVAKTREDHAPLLARVKELEEDVALVSGQRD